MKEKNRDLTIVEYYDTLQREYLVCELRKKIYPSPSDKRYYKKVMDFKRQKIEDIAGKNQLLSIFNDSDTLAQFRAEVYPISGLPTIPLTQKDVVCYYLVDTDVKVIVNEKPCVGKIVRTILEKNIVYVKIKGSTKEVPFPFTQVTRVL